MPRPAGDRSARAPFVYKVTFTIGPFDKAPPFSNPILRMVGIFTRAGYDVRVRIEHLNGTSVPDEP